MINLENQLDIYNTFKCAFILAAFYAIGWIYTGLFHWFLDWFTLAGFTDFWMDLCWFHWFLDGFKLVHRFLDGFTLFSLFLEGFTLFSRTFWTDLHCFHWFLDGFSLAVFTALCINLHYLFSLIFGWIYTSCFDCFLVGLHCFLLFFFLVGLLWFHYFFWANLWDVKHASQLNPSKNLWN